MSGIKFLNQISMTTPPTAPEHILRIGDMAQYMTGKVKSVIRVVMETNFEGTTSGRRPTKPSWRRRR